MSADKPPRRSAKKTEKMQPRRDAVEKQEDQGADLPRRGEFGGGNVGPCKSFLVMACKASLATHFHPKPCLARLQH